MKRSFLLSSTFAAILCFLSTPEASAQAPGVDLKVGDEMIPPGQTVQIKTFLTEPKPISGGKGALRINKALVLVEGIAGFSTSGDLTGVALLNNGVLQLRCISPSLTWGTDADYPLFVVAAQTNANTTIGTQIPLSLLSNSSWWLDGQGQPYPQEVQSGTLTVGGTISVSNVVPGGGSLPPGTVVRLLGSGFADNTQVQVNEIKILNVTVVNSGEIDFTLGEAADLTGTRIRVSGSGGAQVEYYSYLRGIPDSPSTFPLVAAAIPVFPTLYYSSATFPVPQGSQYLTALALQNPNTSPASITAQLYSSASALLGTATLRVASDHVVTRELSELFGSITGAAYIRVSSTPTMQVTAFKIDQTNSSASPIQPIKTK